jgi:hypothetical protein
MLPAIAGLEGLFLMALLFHRRREVLRAIGSWRRNGMIVYVLGSFVGISLILSSLGNFGLLARQRTQVLPFLLMIPAIVKPIRRSRRQRSPAELHPHPLDVAEGAASGEPSVNAALAADGQQARR